MRRGFSYMIMTAVLLLATIILIAPGCDESSSVASNPHQPFIPADPVPTDRSNTGSLLMTLEWRGGDPDGDPVTYDIYFGTTRLPELVAEAYTDTNFTTDILEASGKYYWRVVARDPEGNSISSPLWSFRTDVQEGNFIYPSDVGNRWSYKGAYYYSNPTMEIIPEDLSLDTFQVIMQSEITSLDTLSDDREAYRINSTFYRENPWREMNSYHSSSWYRDEVDGRYLVATTSRSYWPQPSQWDAIWSTMSSSKESQRYALTDPYDVPYLLDPPLKEIAYPLKTGKQWIYISSPFITIEKIVIGQKTIDVPAGTFDCWEIHWRYDWSQDGHSEQIEITDYIADIGIVAHYLQMNGLHWGGGHSIGWQPEGFVDFVEYYELEEYDVK